MKKRILALILPVISLALIVGAIIGIQASAESPTPEILSKNVSYSSRVVLFYAVPVDSIPSGEDPMLAVYSSANAQTPSSYVAPEENTQEVHGKSCYIFKTYGVAAKDIDKVEYVQPVSFKNGAVSASGNRESYSVEEYLYQRLYKDDYALKQEGDGKDYERRNLYYDLLSYGRAAQELLKPGNATIGRAVDYFGVDLSIGDKSDESAILTFDTANTPAFTSFSGNWAVSVYDVFGNLLDEKDGVNYSLTNGSTITFSDYADESGHYIIAVRPKLNFNIGEGQTAIYKGSTVHVVTEGLAASDAEKLISSLRSIVGADGNVTQSPNALSNTADINIVVDFEHFSDTAERANPTTASNPVKLEGTSIFENARYEVIAIDSVITFGCDANPYTPINSSGVAIERFVELLKPSYGIVGFDQGVLFAGQDNLIARQRAIDELEIEARWAALEEKLGDKDIVRELRYFFENMSNETIVKWSGSLYDPATGMFYSSQSGKNAEGYYPHPEATSQNTSFPMSSGMMRYLGGTTFLPEITKYKIIYYLKSIQDPNGEFYVAQMDKKSIATERVGRDRGACITMLSRCGGRPTYTNGSTIGDGITAEQYWQRLVDAGLVTEEDKPIIYWHQNNVPAEEQTVSTFSLNSRSAVMAVSKVVGVSDEGGAIGGSEGSTSGVSHFQSHKAFIDWLLKKDAYNEPYGAISNTSSASSFINGNSSAYTLEQMTADWGASAIKSDANGSYVEIYGKAEGVNTGDGGTDKNVTPFKVYVGDTLINVLISWLNSYVNEAGLFGKVSNTAYDGFYQGWGYQNSNGFMKAIGRYFDADELFPEAEKAAISLLKGICNPEAPSDNILVMYNVWSCLSGLRSNIYSYYPRLATKDNPLTAEEKAEKQRLLDLIDGALADNVNYVTDETLETSYAAYAIKVNYEKSQIFRKSDGGFAHSSTQGTAGWQGGLPVGVPSDNLSDTDGTFCGITSLGSSICSALGISMTSEVPIHMESDYLIWLDSLLKQEYVIKKTPTEIYEESQIANREVDTFEKTTTSQAQKYFASDISAGNNTATVIDKDGSKVLFIDKPTATGIDFKINPMRTDSGAKYFTFEFDMLIENVTADGISNEIYLWEGDTRAYYILLTYSNNTIYAAENGNNSKATTAVFGEWAHFKFVYSENTATYDVIVNGQTVFTGSTLRHVADAPKVSELTAASMWFGGSRTMDCYIDNLSVTKTIGTIDFEDGVIPSNVTGTNGSYTTHTLVDKGDGTKALRIEKPTNEATGGGLYVGLTDVSDVNYNTFVFECDMKVTRYDQMCIYITNPSVKTTDNKYYAKFYSSSKDAVTYGNATAPVGEWVHFKLEYHKIKDGETVYGRTVITVTQANGTTTSHTYTNADTIDLSEANMIMFNCQKATIHDVLYDNIVCKKVYIAANELQ